MIRLRWQAVGMQEFAFPMSQCPRSRQETYRL